MMAIIHRDKAPILLYVEYTVAYPQILRTYPNRPIERQLMY
jgi:hypothetical protein